MPRKVKPLTTESKRSLTDGDKVCFVISPIGKDGTETHKKFKETLDYIIKPAVRNSDFNLRVVRADEIDQSGSFIKDILESLLGSFVVIADLTEQNPNVFYELGVRHALSPRTILIATSIDYIPSDLREYRTIIYENSAKGAIQFQERLQAYLDKVIQEPSRPDNPVLDKLPNLSEQRFTELERENQELKRQMQMLLQKEARSREPEQIERVTKRIERIVALKNAELQTAWSDADGSVTFGEGETEKTFHLPTTQGIFRLYFLIDGKIISDYWYVGINPGSLNLTDELADVRVLMQRCSDVPAEFVFIVVTEDELSGNTDHIKKTFTKIRSFLKKNAQSKFSLEIWDKDGLTRKEQELGIRVEI